MFGYWWNATTATNCWSPALARLVIVCNFDNFLSWGIRQVDSGSLWRLVTACLEILQSDLVALFKSMTEKNLNGLKDLKQRNTTHSAFSPPEINTKTEQGLKPPKLIPFESACKDCVRLNWRRVEVGQSEKGPFLFNQEIADDSQYYKL